ncbi:hypothetical protein P168DRAFT_276781 [Aspergillus campestris IBT 28561]|uniref:Uncharacterized protein n=1 Tax=Aspergillus campestris (strain IBT 28561) TaxID=1392248 RepID=A0A2I1CQN1_ASPC2|nr:uncharacterized protein P168DRAFT_276781 [Aspergillus campestris IBT 28561]PKX99928.1 hypothetical protein P168DRAFT_276781 [Aspergillus campestris IBT 28561]
MGLDFCLLPGMVYTNHFRHSQVLARGWAHVGAGGWTWLVEADRIGDFPASRRTREPPAACNVLKASTVPRLRPSLASHIIPTYITFSSRLSSFLRSPCSHLIYKLSVLRVGPVSLSFLQIGSFLSEPPPSYLLPLLVPYLSLQPWTGPCTGLSVTSGPPHLPSATHPRRSGDCATVDQSQARLDLVKLGYRSIAPRPYLR